MNALTIAGFCISAVVICKAIEKNSSEIKIIMVLAAASIIFIKVIGYAAGISSAIAEIFGQADMDQTYLKILFKGLGICYLTEFTVDYCRDCGENVIASQAELAGKLAMLIISLPLFSALLEIVKTLLM